jgi:hypothetical protein
MYPEYYMNSTFHYQTDGWLSARWGPVQRGPPPRPSLCWRGLQALEPSELGPGGRTRRFWGTAFPASRPLASLHFTHLPTHPPTHSSTPRSANIYEFSTESLFFGRQDSMQRTALLGLHEWLQENGRWAGVVGRREEGRGSRRRRRG